MVLTLFSVGSILSNSCRFGTTKRLGQNLELMQKWYLFYFQSDAMAKQIVSPLVVTRG